jgi:carbonic anhydrase
MREIIWQIDDTSTTRDEPIDAGAARRRLDAGNEAFAGLVGEDGPSTQTISLSGADVGLGDGDVAPAQRPFAALLSCSDARVPAEMVLSQRTNDVFVVRVAGGVLSEEALGSLDFAVGNLSTMTLIASLGHTGCGAVNAVVGVYLEPSAYLALGDSRPLLSLVKNLLGPVRLADDCLHRVYGSDVTNRPGYRDALTELAVVASAGINASTLAARTASAPSGITTVFGVYDLLSRRIGVPGTAQGWDTGLLDTPTDGASLTQMLEEMAAGPRLTGVLDA